jgi:menaquinone-dependent protoporphyrinogen oxidase
MTDASVLLVFASTHGHTGKVAARIGERLRAGGTSVRVVHVDDADGVDPAEHAVVVVGASIHADGHQPALRHWLAAHRSVLRAEATACFSVSLTAADDSDEGRAAAAGYLDALAEDAGLTPVVGATFGGALQYLEYPLPTRVLMRLIARHRGLPTDTSTDVDFTDWAAVDAFADAIAAMVPVPA